MKKRIILSGKMWHIRTSMLICIIVSYLSLSAQNLTPFKENSLWGYFNDKTNIVISPQFNRVGNFHENMAMVEINSKVGFIDSTGNYIIEPIFDFAWSFSGGMAGVKKKGNMA